jgi:transmembrane sensor
LRAEENDIVDLIGKHLAGEASAQETEQVQAWCALSIDNQQYFNQVKTIFEKAARIKDNTLYDTDVAWQKVQAKLRTNKTTWLFNKYTLRIAASLLLICTIGVWVYQSFIQPIKNVELTSNTITLKDSLPDGTMVVLNKESYLSVAYNAKKKKGKIKLRGEAHFDIQHDAEKELIVDVGEVFIRDIGTTFNVQAYPERKTIEVSVQKGEVQFYTEKDEGIFIKAGTKGVYDKLSKKFFIEQADTNVNSYATRTFVFKESDLQSLIDQLNTVYDKKIKISASIKACRVTVSFNNETIETIAEILAETLNLKLSINQSDITLEGEGCE